MVAPRLLVWNPVQFRTSLFSAFHLAAAPRDATSFGVQRTVWGWNLLPAPKVPASQHWIGGENRSANEARDIRRGSEHACGYQLNHQGDQSRQPITTNDGTSRIPFVARPLR